MKRLLGLASLVLLGSIISPPSLAAAQQSATIYVNRSDPTCGGRSPCFSTIQAAINAAGPRATVRIHAGTYPEQLTISGKNNFSGVTEVDRIIIEADPALAPGSVVVRPPPALCLNGHAILIRQSKFLTLRGITVTGATGAGISLLGGLLQNRGIHIELSRIVGNGSPLCTGGGISIALGNADTVIVNTLIHGNTGNGITFSGLGGGPHWLIQNTIHRNSWNGVGITLGHTILLANNLITSNGQASGLIGGRYGVQRVGLLGQDAVRLLNNMVCGNRLGEINGPLLDSTDSGNFTPQGDEGPGVSARPGCEVAANIYANVNGADGIASTADDDFSLKAKSLAVDVGIDPRALPLDPQFDPLLIADYFRDDVFRPQDGDGDGIAEFDIGAIELPNSPPIAHAGADQTAYRGELVTFNASQSSDPEGAPLTYQWSIISQPAGSGIVLGAANTIAPSFTPLFLGDYNFQLVVSDGQFTSAPSIVRVTVINRAPTANAGGPYTGFVGIPVQFSGSGSDADGDPITFSWDFGDGGNGSGSVSAHTYANVGSYTVTLTVTDSIGASAVSRSTATIEGVSVTNVEPATGVIGTLVTITGSSFEPGATQVMFNGASSVVRTITATTITTTVPTTATTGPLTVTTSRGSASRNFTIRTSQDFNLAVNPSTVQTVQGGSTTILIDAIPSNGFSGLIQLATGSLPSGAVANVSPSTLAPNNHSVLTLNTTSSTPVGAHAIEIRASSQVDGQSITKAVTVTLNIAAPGQTVLVGQILDGNDRPLPNVSIKLGGATLTHLGSSDLAGNLFIPLSVTGPQVFLIDGSPANTATINYPTIPVTIDIQAAVINELGYVPRLRGQPVAKLISFIPGQATIIRDLDLPGFKMTIPAGVQIMGWDGHANTQFGVTTVPIDRSPLPPLVLPPGLEARETYLFSFGKVGGGVPTGNIPIDTPNNFGALPGEKADLYFFNEAPDGSAPNQWEKYGTATVSDDGTTLVTDINPATGLQYGIPRFCCGALTPVFNFLNRLFGASGGPRDGGKRAGDPVDVSTGFFYADKTDMVLPGRLPAVVTRTYRTNLPNPGPFGIGTAASFDISLQTSDVFNEQSIVLISPGNKQDVFSRQANGTYINATAPSLRGSVLTFIGPDEEREYSLRFKDGIIWRFNRSGLLIGQSDRNGNTVNYFRDNSNRVLAIQEPAGRVLTISYVGSPGQGLPNIQSITDPIGRQVRYTYDASGRLETVIDPAGGITRYTYDSANRMLTLRDPRGITFLVNEYDANGRVARQTQADGGVWSYAYTSTGTYISQAVVTNPRGHSTTHRFNAAGYQVSETNALGHTTNLERQAATNLVLSITDPLKRVTRFEYDSAANVSRITDPTGNERTFTYDALFNKVTSITDPMNNIARFEYNSAGNLTAAIDPLGNRTTIVYDGFGQPLTLIDPLINVTTFTYDGLGNLTTIADPAGNVTRRSYDQVSRLAAQTDPRGKVTQFSRDTLSHVTQIVDPFGGATQFAYDGNGNLLSVTDARGNTTTYDYDNMDRAITRTDPVLAVEIFQYDGMGNLTRHIDRRNQQASFTYDPLNRLVSGTYADNTSTSFTYDVAGRLVQSADSVSGTIANQFDSLDRVTAEVTNLGSVHYEYDTIGRRSRMTVSGQSPVTYGYDADSRLIQVVQGTQVVTLTYDSLARRTQLTLPNGVSTEYRYDPASRVTALIFRNASGVLGDLNYQYDKSGNRTAVGGSFARTLLPGPIASATYDAANRQVEFGNNTVVYDRAGNLSTVTGPLGETIFSWDARNRLAGTTGPNGNSNFTYDVFGRRAKRIISGQLTQYLYDGVSPVQEISGTAVLANTLPGPGVDEFFTRTEISPAKISQVVSDALGSTIALSDLAGTMQAQYTYEPFGRTVVTDVTSTNPFQYTGRENDSTGLYYYRARYLHPGLQRFISEDPIGFAGGDFNLFTYARNNPTNLRDPSGKFVPVAVVGGALCATGAVAGAAAYQALSGRKSTFGGLLAGAAAGCGAGLGLGWGIGIALETAVPSVMAAGGQVTLWGGLGSAGAQLASTKAAEIGATTIYQTFSGATLSLLGSTGVPATLLQPLWSGLSANLVSGASSATVLIGPALASASVFMTHELPVLLRNQAVLTFIFH